MRSIVRALTLTPAFPGRPNFCSASLRTEVLNKYLNKIGVGELGMTNKFVPATGQELPAADRVFAVMTDLATWSAQEDPLKPINMAQATMLLKSHMKIVQNQCYSNGAVRRW